MGKRSWKGNEILEWKVEKGSEDCQPRTSLRDAKCFIPFLGQLTMNAKPGKYYKIFKNHRPIEMNESKSLFYFAIKHQQNPGDNIWTKKFPLGKNEVRKPPLKAAQNYSVPKLAFQSYSIQTHLWLCSSAKWLPKRDKSRFIQISIDSTSAKNVVYTQSFSKCPGNKRVPVTSFVHIHEKEPNQSVATESEQLANACSKELSFRTVLSSHKLSSN